MKRERKPKASTRADEAATWHWMSPAGKLATADMLYAPYGYDKRGRRVRKGVIDKKEFLRLLGSK